MIDLKVESRAKPETLRSTSDWNGALTYVHWDTTCTRLYYGDSMGGVYEMTVHSSKVIDAIYYVACFSPFDCEHDKTNKMTCAHSENSD